MKDDFINLWISCAVRSTSLQDDKKREIIYLKDEDF